VQPVAYHTVRQPSGAVDTSSVSWCHFCPFVASQRQHATSLCNLTVTIATRHGAFRHSLIRRHRSHGEGVGVVSEVKQHTATHFFEAKNSDRAGRVAVLDARMT
jgi:hypothetical protein